MYQRVSSSVQQGLSEGNKANSDTVVNDPGSINDYTQLQLDVVSYWEVVTAAHLGAADGFTGQISQKQTKCSF